MEKINNLSNVKNYKYSTNFFAMKSKRLKDVSYSFFEEIEMPRDMYPQGICFSDQYLFVSMYSLDKKTMGNVMIFDKMTGKYLLTLGMDTRSHMGGIAFDGRNLWICNSSKMKVERIAYSFICDSIKRNEGNTIDVRNLVEGYTVDVVPSCITFYNGRLWIATHTKITNSQMMTYVFMERENSLINDSIYHIPSKVQGVAFDENGKVYLSTSYGRKSSSYLKIYRSVEEMSKNISRYLKKIEMPPCSEGIAIDDNKYYILFESAGKKYLEGTDGKGQSVSPLDRILIIDRT